jgi:outer membrane protein assembly factor BamB
MPAVMDGRVYFCTAGGVFHAMTITPLASVWQYGQKGDGKEIHAAAATTDAIVLATHDNRVVAIDPKGGKEKWSFRLKARADSSPVVVGNFAFLGTTRGRLHAIDLSNGEETWQTDVGGQFIASPAVSDGRIVIGNNDGVLYCIGNKSSSPASSSPPPEASDKD